MRVGPSHGDLFSDLKPIYNNNRPSEKFRMKNIKNVFGLGGLATHCDIPSEVSGALIVAPGVSDVSATTELMTTICLIPAFSAWRTMFRHPSFAA